MRKAIQLPGLGLSRRLLPARVILKRGVVFGAFRFPGRVQQITHYGFWRFATRGSKLL